MNSTIKIVLGILILQLFSCQVKVLTNDFEKMQLNDNVHFIYERTFILVPINDTLRTFTETISFSESDYWEFNIDGYIIEHGHLITSEDSSFRIEKFSNDYPHGLVQSIGIFSGLDTMYFFDNTVSKGDTTFKKTYFANSRLFRSEIIIKDKSGREIEKQLEYPPGSTKQIKSYYSSGLIKEIKYSASPFDLSRVVYKYNDLNKITNEVLYNKDNKVLSECKYEYSYDKNNNWINRTEYYNKVPIEIKVRTIKYFNK